VFRRCRKCGRQVTGRSCPKCGASRRIGWAFTVDVAPPGADRDQRVRSGFATKAAAVAALNELQMAIATATYVEPSRITLAEYLARWWAAGSWEANTRWDYEVAIRLHIGPRLGTVRLQELTRLQVKGLYDELRREGKLRKRKDTATGNTVIVAQEPLSKKSVQNVHICLRAALNDALKDNLIDSRRGNPAAGAYTYSRRKDRTEMKTWSVEELRAFLSFVCVDRNVALYRTALMTGMRRGELLGLRHRDLDLPNARLHVRQQWTKDGANGRAFKGLKNDSVAWRTIGLDDETVSELRAHVERQRTECARLDGSYRDRDLVFCHPDGTPFDPDWTTTVFERLAGAAPGVLAIRFHDMRHTHATLLLESGDTVMYVAERLGDTVETVVETYAHVTPKMRATAPARLAALVRDNPGVSQAGAVDPTIGAVQ
jgi:integrase